MTYEYESTPSKYEDQLEKDEAEQRFFDSMDNYVDSLNN